MDKTQAHQQQYERLERIAKDEIGRLTQSQWEQLQQALDDGRGNLDDLAGWTEEEIRRAVKDELDK